MKSTTLATQSGLTRRSSDRWLVRAGFKSGRLLIGASKLVAGYQAITASSVPLNQVAAMLGYKSQRTMDSQFGSLLGVRSSALRDCPLTVTAAAAIISVQLVIRDECLSERNRSDDSSDSD